MYHFDCVLDYRNSSSDCLWTQGLVVHRKPSLGWEHSPRCSADRPANLHTMRTVLIVGASAATAAATAAVGFKLFKSSPVVVDEAVAAVLKGNETLLSKKELALVTKLIAEGQSHLFAAWPAPGTQDDLKRKLVDQLVALDKSYHGGLCAYIDNARKLLQDSKEGRNPFQGYTPAVPHGERLDFASPEFLQLEQEGLAEAGHTAFVLVAGGLGERLGYSGIKVALPYESATGTCFLELYCRYIKALQVASGTKKKLPFAIMTSDDTHARTLALLEHHNYFGLDKKQVHLMKQEKVACLIDNNATLALSPGDSYAIQTKPHGHGDVHALLHSTGLVKQWHHQGFKWVAFFQDTNALVSRALTAALGVSARHNYDMNSLAVPRRAKEAIGAIACLKHEDGSSLTINVEYNQLDPLLRSTINPSGDVNDETGWSPFPGNINQLIIKVDSYQHQLARTGGIISEFVNPKYKDASKTEFKSSTRLECMMQDYPKALPGTALVGFTTINQVWASYSPVKNNVVDALAKANAGDPTHSATTAELDVYHVNSYILEHLTGSCMPALDTVIFNGIMCQMYPRVVLSPEWAVSLNQVQAKVKQGSVTLAPGAVLVLDGSDITIEGPLEVSGALVIKAAPGARVRVGSLKVANAGWSWQALAEGATDAPEEERIRGFHVDRKETAEFVFDKPGEYTVGEGPAAPTPAPAAPPPAPVSEVLPAADKPVAAAAAAESVPAPATPSLASLAAAAAAGASADASTAQPTAAAAAAATAASDATSASAPAQPATTTAPAQGVEAELPKSLNPTAAAFVPSAALTPAPPAAGQQEDEEEEVEEQAAGQPAPAKPAASNGASNGAPKKKKKSKGKKK